MAYSVKELFYTLQGEGAQAGHAAVFCRFAGCNLWSGREEDRQAAVCRFCDTDFVGTDGMGGGKFAHAASLADAVQAQWPHTAPEHRLVVLTGGEPLLQLDEPLIEALHARHFRVAIETNGTLPVPEGVDWICVSPKGRAPLRQLQGNELKLVFPQQDNTPQEFEHLDFAHFYLQPLDGPQRQRNTELALAYCREHPRWALSLQTHKWLGIP